MNAIIVTTATGEELLIPAHNIRIIKKSLQNPERSFIELMNGTQIEAKVQLKALERSINSLSCYVTQDG